MPEAIGTTRHTNIPRHEQVFTRVVVNLQRSLEDELKHALGESDRRPILRDRGTIDSLAYWLGRCWPEEEFLAYTSTMQDEHFRRYAFRD